MMEKEKFLVQIVYSKILNSHMCTKCDGKQKRVVIERKKNEEKYLYKSGFDGLIFPVYICFGSFPQKVFE